VEQYLNQEGVMSEEPKMPDLNSLLKEHEEGTITQEGRATLHMLLKEDHAFGEMMPEYRCPQCRKPMMYTWFKGPACTWSKGGCGYSFN